MTASTLRFTTAGSVDDGKSTLIGRLLLDAKGLLEDQLAAVARTTQRRGGEGLDLALFTDGLTLEREQGITIDAAYRYFATPRRRFIIADAPGHEQYTRNMVTAASTADLSVILVDATRGVSPQTRRHAAISAFLGIPNVVLAVNKMDAVGFERAVFDRIGAEFGGIARSLGLPGVQVVPISALEGDMVVHRGERLPWYQGPTLLELLESAPSALSAGELRFPVQLVSSARFGEGADRRGYMGRIESGSVAVGDAIVVSPRRYKAIVSEIHTFDGALPTASAGRSVTLVLDRQLDVARGDVLSHPREAPTVKKQFAARLAWLDQEPLSPDRRYWLKHGAAVTRATIDAVEFRIDLQTLLPAEGEPVLEFNDLGCARITTVQGLALDPYTSNPAGGRFVLIDDATHHTVAAGMVGSLE